MRTELAEFSLPFLGPLVRYRNLPWSIRRVCELAHTTEIFLRSEARTL